MSKLNNEKRGDGSAIMGDVELVGRWMMLGQPFEKTELEGLRCLKPAAKVRTYKNIDFLTNDLVVDIPTTWTPAVLSKERSQTRLVKSGNSNKRANCNV